MENNDRRGTSGRTTGRMSRRSHDRDGLYGLVWRDAQRVAVGEGRLEVLTETQFWERLGLVDTQQSVQRLYTPRMLADLLDVPVNIIRRWHRRGLIVPARVVHRLPYFDFQEVSTARQLARLLAPSGLPLISLITLVKFAISKSLSLTSLPSSN